MFGLTTGLTILLALCILCACIFEFVNGFHDTANAVATVIYTKSLKPTYAVMWSGFLNFLGVFFGGISVATGILTLLPVETLIDPNIYHNIGMVLAILLTAIMWNLATWYVAIPCSSSHTLIGSILGVGLGFYLLPSNGGVADPINWKKAGEIGTSLLISPLFGFSLAVFLMFMMRRLLTKKNIIFKEPEPDQKPPMWIRIILILTCSGVSFFHGSNDGQKGVGLMMLILIAIVPGYFALNKNLETKEMVKPAYEAMAYINKIDTTELKTKEKEELVKITKGLGKLEGLTKELEVNPSNDSVRFQIRKNILVASKGIDKLFKSGNVSLSENNQKELKHQVKELKGYTDYAPTFVLILISLSLGLGTMIGWKRIVVTIGEKIGKQHLTYAQGAAAELVATATIGASTGLGLPVSTTHVLSSGIAGSMVASKGIKNLQSKTIRNILIAWVLTLPVCMVCSGLLFWLFRTIL